MRVAHLTTVDMALRYLLWPQLRAVTDQGWESIGISADGACSQELREAGIHHVPLRSSTRGMNPVADVRAVVELWRTLRRERVDVLHTHNPKPGLYGRIVGRLAGVPVVVNTVHGLYATEDDRLPKRLLVYALEAVASRFSDAELVQSSEDLELMRRLRIAPAHKLRLLGNGIDLTRFDANRVSVARRRELRAELGAADGQIVVGMVGRLVAEKGYVELFDAARSLGDGYVVVALGHADPEKGDALSDADLARGREAGVRFLGMRADIDVLYAAMDIFVLPSHREGVPRAAMEAAAMGLPVVATDIRGCREVVEDGVSGLLVPVGDASALAAAIRALGTDAALRRRLGAGGRTRAADRFDERRVVRIVLDTYREALERKGIAADPSLSSTGGRTRRAGHRLNDAFKRALDIVVALVGLAVAAPLFVLLAPAIRATLGTSVLFVQERGGRNGRTFRLYKFRTMRDLHDEDGRPLPDGERLTRLGRLLRSTSLDELPSLINVLKGDMSLVGPRPLIADYLELYTPEQTKRHEVRPGITGLVQVGGRNALSWDEKFAADLHYVENRSPWLDLKILARTAVAVLHRSGISQDGHATMPRFVGIPEDAGPESSKTPIPRRGASRMNESFNVLISSAGRRVALLDLFRRTLRSMGFAGKVLAADMSSLSSAFQRADEATLVPPCSDPAFVETMLEVCRERAIRLLIPTLDPELPIYAANRERFAEIGTTVAISSPEVVSIAYDKSLTHSWLVEHGFPTIRQAEPEVLRGSNGWSFPAIVKPRTGSASIGVSVVRDRAELEVATRDGGFVVQTIARGDEYTIDVLADRHGRCLCAVPRRRIEVRAGEVSKGVTVRSQELIELAFGICNALPGAYGPINIQVFADPDTGHMDVIEVNPRFSGGFPLSWQAGARYPQWLIEEILGREPGAGSDNWQDGLVMLRWDEAVFTTADRVGLQ